MKITNKCHESMKVFGDIPVTTVFCTKHCEHVYVKITNADVVVRPGVWMEANAIQLDTGRLMHIGLNTDVIVHNAELIIS